MKQHLCLLALFFCLSSMQPQNCWSVDPSDKRLTEKSFLFLWPGQSPENAQLNLNDSIVTDRPDFTEASSTVGNGVSQTELGYTFYYTRSPSDPSRSLEHSYPEFLLRQGILADWLEFRVASSLSSIDSRGSSATGFNNLYLGFKIGLVPQQGILPEVSIVPQITVPTGSRALGSDHLLAGTNLVYGWDIFDSSFIGASTQFNRAVEGDSLGLYTEWAQSITTGTSLSENWGTYLEWYAFFPYQSTSTSSEHFVNGGFTYLISRNIQWDIRAGKPLEGSRENFFTGMGLSIRFL